MIHCGGTARGKIYTGISLLKYGGPAFQGVCFPVPGHSGAVWSDFHLKKNGLR